MKLLSAFLAALVFTIFAGLTAQAKLVLTGEYMPNQLIVKYKKGVRRDRQVMEELYDASKVVKVKRFHDARQLEQLFLEEGTDLGQAIESLKDSPYVEYAEPNYIVHALPIETSAARGTGDSPGGIPCIPGMEIPGCTPMGCIAPNFPPGCSDSGTNPPSDNPAPSPAPSPAPEPTPAPPSRPPVADKPADVIPPIADPELAQAWGITKVGADHAWATSRGSSKMVVAVIDTGVDYNHEDLSFNIWRNPNPDAKANDLVGYDFIHNDGLPFDDHSHGTHCSGVIGAVGGNGKGISGINQRVSIMAIKFLSADGSGDLATAIRAIDYATDHGAKVLSNSWGGSGAEDVQSLKDAVIRAEAKGALFVAAAGNDSSDNDSSPEFPAGFNTPNEIAVAATDEKDALTYFSNWGKTTVQVAAPGMNVYSTVPGNKYERMSGTSMACPHVAGAAALVWAANPEMTYKEVKQRLIDTSDKLPTLADKIVSGGRINVSKAVLKNN